MKKLELNKLNEPRFDELFETICDLKDFLDEDADFNDAEWKANLDAILDFQSEDGSFALLEMDYIPSDARVDFCYIPTYICSAVLMKAFLTGCDEFTSKGKLGLFNGLKASCGRNLTGHGYEALKGQIEAVNIFIKAGLNEFLDVYPDFCCEFSEMIKKIASNFQDKQSQGNFLGPWGESYEDEIRAINECFCQRTVFVYGTLMKGEANHRYLEGAAYLGRGYIEGYDIYNCGWYPAIVPGEGFVIGELYRVSIDDIPSIDELEGEGELYLKRCETVRDGEGNETSALVYVYNGDCSGFEKIASWKEYVWYVSYGSNMLHERFQCYIRGESYAGSRHREACGDPSLPLAVRTFEIPYAMYFGNYSGSWQDGGVSFLDVTGKGKALGVAYLITKEQFEHVAAQENCGRFPEGDESYGWYENIIDLGELDGFEAKTITNKEIRPYNEPCMSYLDTLFRGIRQNWPEMTDDEIHDYLDSCLR